MADDMQGGYSTDIFRNGILEPNITCNLCSKVLREPVQTFCGHRFCKSCINSKIRSEGQIKCTACEQEGFEDSIILPDQIFPDKAIRKMMLISRFQVVCDSKDCPWKGTFKQYEEHFNVCDFKTQACPYCQQSVYRNLLQIHLERECRKYELTCDDCGRKVVRERMNHHQQFECQIEKIQCPVGCGEVKLRHYADHFREKKHENWVVKEISNLAAILEEVKGSERHLLTSVSESTASSFQMNEKIAALEGQILQLRTQTNIGTGISQLSDSQGSSGDRGATNIDAKIRQQVEMNMQSINERLDALYREFERHKRQTESKIEQFQDYILSLERHLALKDMSMAELELKAQSMEAASYDGTFMWRVHDFTKKHQDAVQGRTISIYSPPFYTTRRGYKMCARLYPNGDGMGKGSHLSLFFVVMRGNYDALLKWPFSQRVTFYIVNQTGGEHVIDSFRPDPQSTSFKRPTSDMNIASGCPLFIRLEMLQNPKYAFLKDDTLFLKIEVDTDGLTDPVSNLQERIKVTA